MSKPINRRHVVGNVRTGRELSTADRLRKRLGLKVICPFDKVKVRKRRLGGRRETIEVEKPILPGYLVTEVEQARENQETIYQDPDFHYFIRSKTTGELLTLDEGEVAAIRSLEGKGVFAATSPAQLAEQMMLNARVRVFEGPFGGLRGIVKRTDRGRALVEFFGDKSVWLPAGILILDNS